MTRAARVGLRPIEERDLELYVALHCDPAMMEHLGGPLPEEGLEQKLARDAAATAAGESCVFVVEVDGVAAGTISVWTNSVEGRDVLEVGWMVLPAFQGRGVASAAVRALVDRARAEGRSDVLHAFPPVDNAASNSMCRKLGFELVGECDYEFRDRPLRCNHWALDLGTAPSRERSRRRSEG